MILRSNDSNYKNTKTKIMHLYKVSVSVTHVKVAVNWQVSIVHMVIMHVKYNKNIVYLYIHYKKQLSCTLQ